MSTPDPELAHVLVALADLLHDDHEYDRAHDLIAEAADIFGRLATTARADLRRKLASALHLGGPILSDMGRNADATGWSTRTVDPFADIVRTHRHDLEPELAELAEALHGHALALDAGGLAAEAGARTPAPSRSTARLTDNVDVKQSDEHVTVTARGASGLYVGAYGERCGWLPLPHDALGSVLDEGDATTRITGLLRTLSRLHLPRPQRVALGVGVAGATSVVTGHAMEIGRRTAVSGSTSGADSVTCAPDQSLPFVVVENRPADVAAELTRRMLAAMRHGAAKSEANSLVAVARERTVGP